MHLQELSMAIRDKVAEVGEIDNPDAIGLDDHLMDEVGLDSMLLLELLTELESTFQVTIPEDEYPGMTTVNACAKLVARYGGTARNA